MDLKDLSKEEKSPELKELIKENLPEVYEKIEGALDESDLEGIVQIGIYREYHEGPLPDVKTLEGYNRIIPNGGERVMQMAELNQKSRINLETQLVENEIKQSNRGQIMAYTLALICIGCTFYFGYHDKLAIASLFGFMGLAGLVTAFLKKAN